jgi:hypothetical protein
VASATRGILAVAILLTAGGCSGSSPALQTSPSTTVAASATLPRVDLVDVAISALEDKLAGPQQYFEINATSQLVNLFVSLNDDKLVQPWVYLDGELSSSEPHEATGFSFAKTALDFDPDKVLTRLEAELPQSRPDVFFIEGGQGGVVRYSVTVTSSKGGQLVVVVGPDGAVKSVGT